MVEAIPDVEDFSGWGEVGNIDHGDAGPACADGDIDRVQAVFGQEG